MTLTEEEIQRRLDVLLPICDAYRDGEELTSQQIDQFHTNADMGTVRWLIRTVYGMTSHRDTLQSRLDALEAEGSSRERAAAERALEDVADEIDRKLSRDIRRAQATSMLRDRAGEIRNG